MNEQQNERTKYRQKDSNKERTKEWENEIKTEKIKRKMNEQKNKRSNERTNDRSNKRKKERETEREIEREGNLKKEREREKKIDRKRVRGLARWINFDLRNFTDLIGFVNIGYSSCRCCLLWSLWAICKLITIAEWYHYLIKTKTYLTVILVVLFESLFALQYSSSPKLYGNCKNQFKFFKEEIMKKTREIDSFLFVVFKNNTIFFWLN